MELSYFLLILTCFLYGMTTFISRWDDFGAKLANVLVIITIIVLTLITGEDGIDFDWANFLIPIPAVYIGYIVGSIINSADWCGVFAVLSILSLIATIITTCCGL